MDPKELRAKISFLGSELTEQILLHGQVVDLPPASEVLRENQFVQNIPLVLDGLIKVFTKFEDKEFLLYYIQARESCIMSFSAFRNNHPSKVYAITELPSRILLLPVEKLHFWLLSHPVLHQIFYKEYDKRYNDLLLTLEQVLFTKLEERLLEYLWQKSTVLKISQIEFSPTKIAKEMGTVREVISRMIKKLEAEGKIYVKKNHIIFAHRD